MQMHGENNGSLSWEQQLLTPQVNNGRTSVDSYHHTDNPASFPPSHPISYPGSEAGVHMQNASSYGQQLGFEVGVLAGANVTV
eukprot:1158420-Pelagomonas_calceolata.AAC.4